MPEQGLTQLLDILRWRWKLVLPVALVTFGLATVYVGGLPSTYSAEAVVAFAPRADVESAGADTVRVVTPKYLAYVSAPATIRRVAVTTGHGASELSEALDAEVVADTGNLLISTELTAPGAAAEAANAFADVAIDLAASDQLLSAEIVARAIPPRVPSGPPRKLLQAAALLVGAFLGLALALLVESQRPRLRSWMDMARITGYRVLGRIPESRKMRRPKEALADPTVGSSFRALRANLDREVEERGLSLIVVTSPEEGDGKTMTAGLLAESYARLGTTVLLVDADMWRANAGRTFGLRTTPGLAEVLRGEVPLDEAVAPGWTEGLFVLATRIDPDAGDILARNFAEAMKEAATRFEMIVVDTPPLLGVADARGIAAGADGVLLVISSHSAAEPVNEAVLALETLKAPVLGVVANRVHEPRRAYQYLRPA